MTLEEIMNLPEFILRVKVAEKVGWRFESAGWTGPDGKRSMWPPEFVKSLDAARILLVVIDNQGLQESYCGFVRRVVAIRLRKESLTEWDLLKLDPVDHCRAFLCVASGVQSN